MRHGLGDLQEQLEASDRIEPSIVSEAVDACALDVLEHEVRLAGRRDAGVEQARDVRVRQSGEQRPLAPEALVAAFPEQRQVQQLHGDGAFEPSVAPPGAPDRAHAAHPQRRFERVRAHRIAGERRRRRIVQRQRGLEKSGSRQPVVLGQQARKNGRQLGLLARDVGEQRLAPRRIELQRLVEQRAQRLPAVLIEAQHPCILIGISRRIPTAAGFRARGAAARGPWPSCARPCAARRLAWPRFRRTTSRKRTSDRPARRVTDRVAPARRAHDREPPQTRPLLRCRRSRPRTETNVISPPRFCARLARM